MKPGDTRVHTGGRDSEALSMLLAGLVRDVAGIELGQDDGFFEAGLTSALLLRVLTRLRDQLDTDLPFWLLFKYPTRRSLARSLADGPAAGPRDRPMVPSSARPTASLAVARRELRRQIRDMDR
jgi:hypothetical protein